MACIQNKTKQNKTLLLGKTVTMQSKKNHVNSFSEGYVRLKQLLSGIIMIRQESNVSIMLQNSDKLHWQSFHCIYCKIVSLLFSGDSETVYDSKTDNLCPIIYCIWFR